MNLRSRLLLVSFIALALALVATDYYVGKTQRHLYFVTGWFMTLGLVFLAVGLRADDREVKFVDLERFRNRWALKTGLLFFLLVCQVVHCDYNLPTGVFESFLLILMTLTLGTGVLLRRAEQRLHLAVSMNAANNEVVRLETLERYSTRRLLHLSFVLAAIPAFLLHEILVHAHGALSNLVDKGVS